jgi:hypothetical protein
VESCQQKLDKQKKILSGVEARVSMSKAHLAAKTKELEG